LLSFFGLCCVPFRSRSSRGGPSLCHSETRFEAHCRASLVLFRGSRPTRVSGRSLPADPLGTLPRFASLARDIRPGVAGGLIGLPVRAPGLTRATLLSSHPVLKRRAAACRPLAEAPASASGPALRPTHHASAVAGPPSLPGLTALPPAARAANRSAGPPLVRFRIARVPSAFAGRAVPSGGYRPPDHPAAALARSSARRAPKRVAWPFGPRPCGV